MASVPGSSEEVLFFCPTRYPSIFLLFKTSYGISDSDKRYTLNYTLTVHTYAVLSYTVQSGLLTNTPLRSLLTDVLFKIPCTVKASDLVLASLTSLRFFSPLYM